MEHLGHDHQRFLDGYQDCKDQLYTYLMYRSGFQKETAEDLFMDVVSKAYEHFEQFDENKGTFKTWIFAIARNHLKNWWRQKKRHPLSSLEALQVRNNAEEGRSMPGEPTSDEYHPERYTSRSIAQSQVQRILALLKPDQRDLILWRYVHDLDSEEMSHILGQKPGAIRTRLSRALKQFQVLYQQHYSW